MRLDIIGSAGSYPAPDSACSSYLLQSGKTSLLLDVGNGAQARLYRRIEPSDLDAIVVSHGHLDHFADLVGLYHYLKFASPPKSPIPVFTNDETIDRLHCVLGSTIDPKVFSLTRVGPGSLVTIRNVEIRFHEANHPVATLITRVSDGRSAMCYGADGDLCQNLSVASQNADLLLGESTWTERAEGFPPGLHLDAMGLASLAETSHVGQLVVTHIAYPANKEKILAIVKAGYSGIANLAEEGRTFWC